ncbi:Hpt domain-containing protein [Ciceribacter azotifigens]|uniref:Hpt domain-containing protein n=1 Tax=Ciceribacter azotifigens TaxID=2069303 RepID=UPI003A8C4BC3
MAKTSRKISQVSPDEASVGEQCRSRARPVDLVYLAARTHADRAAEMEILQAFVSQVRHCLRSLVPGGDAAANRTAAAGLRATALAVGAFALSATAEAVERDGTDPDAIKSVYSCVLEAENFVSGLCR